MYNSELLCKSIEQYSAYGVVLIHGEYKDNSVWLYLLLNEEKEKMLMGMSKIFPLKLEISDYGKIIKSGEGSKPPENIIWQITNGDFLNSTPDKESEVFCLVSKTEEGREFYHYVDVPYYLIGKFKALQSSGNDFDIENYGDILHSDWGKPTEEVINMMNEKYGIKAPEFATCH